jgi:hypothetical protein
MLHSNLEYLMLELERAHAASNARAPGAPPKSPQVRSSISSSLCTYIVTNKRHRHWCLSPTHQQPHKLPRAPPFGLKGTYRRSIMSLVRQAERPILAPALRRGFVTPTSQTSRLAAAQSLRTFQASSRSLLPISGPGGASIGGLGSAPPSYFQRPSLPANTVIRFVPQQTAWIVERMGKFNRILPPGFTVLMPFIDRIAYVKSLKEQAFEIPSQSAITADNVTLELDGVLYTRVFDAYKARYV